MTSTLKKWGNSLAVRIPKDVVKRLNLIDGVELDLVVEGESLKITKKRDFTLDDFMKGLSEENRHPEIDVTPLGKEDIDY